MDSAQPPNSSSDLDRRTGWPDELCVLLSAHPRETWASSRSALVRFWIDKHNHLRRQSAALIQAGTEYRETEVTPMQLGAWVAPRLQGFLAELHGHHQIEDFHYFPAWRSAESRLAAGFDVLGRDHEQIHEGIMQLVDKVNAFILTLQNETEGNADAQQVAADHYIDAINVMHRRLDRHLADEEDLIIPIMLARGQ